MDGEWLEKDGKEICLVTWPETDTERGQVLEETPDRKLKLLVEYMGNRTEVWVSVINNGIETARHNARMIETIVWMP